MHIFSRECPQIPILKWAPGVFPCPMPKPFPSKITDFASGYISSPCSVMRWLFQAWRQAVPCRVGRRRRWGRSPGCLPVDRAVRSLPSHGIQRKWHRSTAHRPASRQLQLISILLLYHHHSHPSVPLQRRPTAAPARGSTWWNSIHSALNQHLLAVAAACTNCYSDNMPIALSRRSFHLRRVRASFSVGLYACSLVG